jgi:hypothetical protein
MLQVVLVAALVPVLGGAPRGVEKPTKPTSPPPKKAVAIADEKGILLLTVSDTRRVPVSEERLVQKDGVVRREIVTASKEVTVTTTQRWETRDIQAFDRDGRRIDARELPRLLKNRTPVLVSADGKKVHPSYVKDAGEKTVVLVVPLSKDSGVPKRTLADGARPDDKAKHADKK